MGSHFLFGILMFLFSVSNIRRRSVRTARCSLLLPQRFYAAHSREKLQPTPCCGLLCSICGLIFLLTNLSFSKPENSIRGRRIDRCLFQKPLDQSD